MRSLIPAWILPSNAVLFMSTLRRLSTLENLKSLNDVRGSESTIRRQQIARHVLNLHVQHSLWIPVIQVADSIGDMRWTPDFIIAAVFISRWDIIGRNDDFFVFSCSQSELSTEVHLPKNEIFTLELTQMMSDQMRIPIISRLRTFRIYWDPNQTICSTTSMKFIILGISSATRVLLSLVLSHDTNIGDEFK